MPRRHSSIVFSKPVNSDVSRHPTRASLDFSLVGCGRLSRAAMSNGFATFDQLAGFVRDLPYARLSNPLDCLAVLEEGRGTCSAKHRLLAAVAHECGYPEVQLTIGIYEMCEENTPGVRTALCDASVDSIPEAHCYLTVDGERFDYTGLPSGKASPFDSLIEEHFVGPADLPRLKEHFHRKALRDWAVKIGRSESSAWETREACIAALAADSSIELTRAGEASACSADPTPGLTQIPS